MRNIIPELFGKNPQIESALSIARQLSQKSGPMVITGEKGTGKKTLGIYIHELSGRNNQPLLLVDCADDQKVVEDKILGVRDNQTGRFNRGVLEKAHKGTVILSNIDGMSEYLQKKLYKIFLDLPDYEIDVRIIATTSKNLSKLVGSGRFYRAMYIYLSGHHVNLPPLRERKEDIPFLITKYAHNICKELNKEEVEFDPECMEKLQNYYWGNNILELESVLRKNIEENSDNFFDTENFIVANSSANDKHFDGSSEGLQLMSLKEAEKLLIRKALIHTSENRTQAAKILGVSIRTLRNKINEYRNDGNDYFVNLR